MIIEYFQKKKRHPCGHRFCFVMFLVYSASATDKTWLEKNVIPLTKGIKAFLPDILLISTVTSPAGRAKLTITK